MQPHDTVLLDVDGTLADSSYHHALAWHRAFARQGLPTAIWRLHRAIGMGGDKLVAVVSGADVEARHGDALRAAWEEEYAVLLEGVGLLPGARELLLHLHGLGFALALASSGKARFTEHVVELLDLPEGTLAAVTSSDDAEESKPEPDILQVALERAGGSSAIVLGDTPYDVASAARMGAPCVVVRSGGFGAAELESAGAVLVVDEPADLLDADWAALARSTPPTRAARAHSPLPD